MLTTPKNYKEILGPLKGRGPAILACHFLVGVCGSVGLGLMIPALFALFDDGNSGGAIGSKLGGFGRFVEQVSPEHAALLCFALTISLILLKGVFLFARIAFSNNLIVEQAMRLQRRILDYVVRRDLHFTHSTGMGMINNQLNQNIYLASRYYHERLELAGACTQIAAFMTVLCVISTPMLVVCLFIVSPLYFLLRKLGRTIRADHERQIQMNHNVARDVHEMMSGLRLVKFGGREDEHVELIQSKSSTILSLFKRQSLLVNGMPSIVEVGSMILLVVLSVTFLFMRAHALAQSLPTLTRFFAFLVVLARMIPLVSSATQARLQVPISTAAVADILSFTSGKAHVEHPPGNQRLDHVRQGIRFENVSFLYPGSAKKALNGLNFNIREGENVALIGHSGSGKSTLIDILLRYYTPTEGTIYIDGVDYHEIVSSNFRKLVGYVPQDPMLFFTTIRENVRYFMPTASESEVWSALAQADLSEFVEHLPEGIDTIVGERGALMSGGQRQRMCIARALITNPKILIFDEATSSLDAASEAKIVESIKRASRGRTTMTISHSLATVKHCDRYIVLEHGSIVEAGNWDNVASGGRMASFVEKQLPKI